MRHTEQEGEEEVMLAAKLATGSDAIRLPEERAVAFLAFYIP